MFSGFYEYIERNYHEKLVSSYIMYDLACRHNLIKNAVNYFNVVRQTEAVGR